MPQMTAMTVKAQAAAITGAALTAGLDWLAFNPDQPFERVRDAVLASLGLPVPQ